MNRQTEFYFWTRKVQVLLSAFFFTVMPVLALVLHYLKYYQLSNIVLLASIIFGILLLVDGIYGNDLENVK